MSIEYSLFFLLESDFRLTPSISIPTGYSLGCLTISILSSSVVERVEEIHLSISERTAMAVVENATTSIIIEDHGSMHMNYCVDNIIIIFYFSVVVLGFDRESYTISEGGLLKLTVSKSPPCDFDIPFQVHVDGHLYKESILGSTKNRAEISVFTADDELALKPDKNHILTLSLVVPDPQVELSPFLSNLTIISSDSKYSILFFCTALYFSSSFQVRKALLLRQTIFYLFHCW